VIKKKSKKYLNVTGCLILFAGLFLLTSGCVSTTKHNALQEQFNVAMLENKDLQARIDVQDRKIVDEIAGREDLERAKREMVEKLQEEIGTNMAKIEALEDILRITVVDKLFFSSGSADIRPSGSKILAKIAPILKKAKGKNIKIIGHADPLPPGPKLRTKYPSNWELSVARSTAVIQVLQWGHGIDPARLMAAGAAHYRPLQLETGKVTRAANRVVEILLVPSTKDMAVHRDRGSGARH